MGVFKSILCPTLPDTWDRGTRGWGSGPASTYNSCGVAQTRVLTDFQQHSPPYDATVNPQDETAADMFLNWVYRVADPEVLTTNPNASTGFKNISWNPADKVPNSATTCDSVGCADSGNPGEARFNWMQDKLTAIFSAHSWKILS